MNATTWSLRRLDARNELQIEGGLTDLLIDCVEGGASVSFMHPLTRDRAIAFWQRVAQGVLTLIPNSFRKQAKRNR